MKTTIYYFSGTGNSLKIAKEIAEKIENCDLMSISKILGQDKIIVSSEKVGFVFPLHALGLPIIMPKFIKKIDLGKAEFIFAVISRSEKNSWGALHPLIKLLKKKSKTLSAGFYVNMPRNYILKYDVCTEEEQQDLFKEAELKIEKIVEIIRDNKKILEEENFLIRFFTTIYHALWAQFVQSSDKSFIVQKNCTSCGICKQVCPVDNITLENGKPIWHHQCCQCLACINSCPEKCIQYGKKTLGKKRYLHPDISIDELAGQK